jgi:hypothetical protein
MTQHRLRQFTGAVWVAFAVAFLVIDSLAAMRSRFPLGWSYYLTTWGYLGVCILAGVLLFGPAPLGRWLITLLAGLLAVYSIIIWSEAGADAAIWAQLWCLSMLAFAVWSVLIAQRRKA